MRVLLGVIGSRGDVQPMVALALGLRRAGHDVRFAASPNFRSWVESYRFPFVPIGPDMETMLGEIGTNLVPAFREMRRRVHVQYDDLRDHLDGLDVIVGSGAHCAGATFAEHLGIPFCYTAYSPVLFPSRQHPSGIVSRQDLPGVLNTASWSAATTLWNWLFRSGVNAQRARYNLRPVSDVWAHFLTETPVLAAETALAPMPEDITYKVTPTGAWILPETDDLDPDLDAFLRDGDPPVYIGFGSMPDGRADRTSQLLLEAVASVGVRAVISAGWAKLGAERLPPGVRVVGATPHGKLFPRCAAIVHHGGAGTTAAATRAGVPQVIVPHLFDQFHWAKCVHEHGLSPRPIWKDRLTAEGLAAALRACVEDDAMRTRARSFAPKMTRDGVERMVRHVESLVGASPAAQPATAMAVGA